MKKKILKLSILFAFVFAVNAYSNINNIDDESLVNEIVKNNTKTDSSSCDTCNPCKEPCNTCKEPCDPCCEPCEPCCEPCEPCCEPCKPCCTEKPKTGQPCECAYNAPARIDPACGLKAWVTASFIYWQPKEKGLELGREFVSSGTTLQINPINLDFDYKPGFKVGAGFSTCRDDWTFFLEYTRLTGNQSKSKNLGDNFSATNYLLSPWFYATSGTHYSSLSLKWHVNYNIFDLMLGRPYYVGKKLIFKPYYGLKGGWINQKLSGDGANATNTFSINNSLKTWLVGPKAGVDTDWMIGCNFRIFGNAALALVYEDFKTKISQVDDEGTVTDFSSRDKFGYVIPNIDYSLGLGYGDYFCNNEWYFDLTVGYDFHYYADQNWIKYVSETAHFSDDAETSSLILHGLTVTARLDF